MEITVSNRIRVFIGDNDSTVKWHYTPTAVNQHAIAYLKDELGKIVGTVRLRTFKGSPC